MEGIHVVRDLLTKEDYMTRIDLKDAYLVIPAVPPSATFPLGEPGLRVCLPTIWPGFSPLCVHQDNEGGSDFSTQQRYPIHCLPGRPPPDEQEPISPTRAYHSDARPPGSIWLSSELSKVSPDTLTGGGIPRVCRRLNSEGATTTQDKVDPDNDRSFPGSDMQDDLSKIPSPTHQQDVGSHSGSLSSPFALQKLAGHQTQGPGQLRLRRADYSVRGSEGGPEVVDQQFKSNGTVRPCHGFLLSVQ